MTSKLIVSMLGCGAIFLSAPSFSADINAVEEVKIVTVDYKGKPPFKRRIETLPMSDVAALETSKPTRVRSVDFKGKPPFRRNVESLEVVDVAALAPADEESKTSFRGKPPFKRNR